MWELYGLHLITGNEFTIKTSHSRAELQRMMNARNSQASVAYFIVHIGG